MVTVAVTLRGDGVDRTEVVVERATTREAVIAGLSALVYLCPPELRPGALQEVARLGGDPALVRQAPT